MVVVGRQETVIAVKNMANSTQLIVRNLADNVLMILLIDAREASFRFRHTLSLY